MQESSFKTTASLNTGELLFWMKLFTGGIFGVLTYFVRRFHFEWAFLWAFPLFAVLSYIIGVLLILRTDREIEPSSTIGMALKTAASYTGTWVMSYFVLGGLCFLVGW